MGTYTDVGDTIEGKAVDVQTRKLLKKGLKKHPITNETMMLYSCDRNSNAEVKAAMEIEEEDERTAHFHREVGDALNADAISVFVDFTHKSITGKVKEGASARHGAIFFTTGKHTISTIRTPLQNLLKSLGYTSNIKIG